MLSSTDPDAAAYLRSDAGSRVEPVAAAHPRSGARFDRFEPLRVVRGARAVAALMAGQRLAFVGVAAAYAVLCLGTAAVWEFAHDEGVTWEQVAGPLPIPTWPEAAVPVAQLEPWVEGARPLDARGIVARLGEEGGMHPPLYYLGFAAWLRAIGSSRSALSLAPIALGILLLGTTRTLATRAAPGLDPLWAAALLATSPWWVGFTVFTRPYAWLVLLSALATLAALRTSEGLPGAAARGGAAAAGWRWPALFVACSIAGLYSLYHYAFVVLWHAAMLAVVALGRPRAARGRALAQVVALGVVIAAAFVPWLPMLMHHVAATTARPWYFSKIVPLQQWPIDGLHTLRFFALGPAERAAGFAAPLLLLGVSSAVLAAWSFRTSRWRELPVEVRALWACALVMPVGIAVSDLSRGTHTLFFSKLHFAWALLLPLLVVRGASQLPRRAGRALLVAWIALQLAACVQVIAELRAPSRVEQLASQVRRDDGASRRIAISTRLHGYAQSLVHALCEAGVRDARIVHVPAAQLAEYVASAAREPGVEKIWLVNLAAFYQPGAMWNAASVQAAIGAARRAGWPSVPEDRLAETPAPALGYAIPLQVRYFSK